MITRDYTERIKMEDAKLSILEKEFPTFFREKNPQAILIHIDNQYFYQVKRSLISGTDITKGQFQDFKQPPMPETIKLSYNITEDNETHLISYSDSMPKALDNQGLKHEFEWNSGCYYNVGHGSILMPGQNTE